MGYENMTEEKEKKLKNELLRVFSDNKCTVAEAKAILELISHDIETSATVHVKS